ncbi:NADP-dependent oxidoreductase domain-containing protein [Hyaloscypha finlandica]|nr:NADP-dependent oxidoreductase domain-containing protein [Hyaloscypha finlandica]
MGNAVKIQVDVAFGAMAIDKAGLEWARIHTVEDTVAILEVFRKHGYTELDTARAYTGGTYEEMLGDAKWQEKGIKTQTTDYIRAGLLQSFEALKTDKIDMLYLHARDRKTHFQITTGEADKMHKEGKFGRVGLSKFVSWEVNEICEISKKNGWAMPSVYQAIYNELHRAVEPELFPCLGFYIIALYGFQPLAGGLFTGKFSLGQTDCIIHFTSYWNEDYFKLLSGIHEAAERHGLTVVECALRWMMHHSQLKGEFHDAVFIGPSSAKQLESNLALDNGWQFAKGFQSKY